MKLYVVRHGIAQSREADGVSSDAERGLTGKGRRRTQQAAEGLATLGCQPDLIATSPLRRARETARLIADVLGTGAEPEPCDPLAPGAAPQDLIEWLREQTAEEVMVVGHMPDVAWAVAFLVGGRGGVELAFRKCAVCCLSFDAAPAQGDGRLEWLLQPRQLRLLAGTEKEREDDD
jgi:phosphohistidine phosphatase